MDDINTYAIELELRMMDMASAVLDDVSMRVESIQEQFDSLATSLTTTLAGAIEPWRTSLVDIQAAYADIVALGPGAAASAAAAAASSADSLDVSTAETEMLTDEFVPAWVEILEHLREKQGLLDKELGTLNEEGKAAKAISDQTATLVSNTDRARVASNALLDIFNSMRRAFLDATLDAERFYTANYRAYGTQQGIAQEARGIAFQYQLLTKEAMDAYAVLGNVRAPRDEIASLAGTVGQLHRITGVSITSLGEWTHHLRASGFDVKRIGEQAEFAAASMRKFGTSTADLDKALRDTNMTAEALSSLFDDDPLQIQNFKDAQLIIAGFKTHLQLSETAVAKIQQAMSVSALQMQMISSRTGIDTTTAAGRFNALIALGKQFQEETKGMTQTQRQLRLAALGDVYKVDADALRLLSVQMGVHRKDLVGAKDAFAILNKEVLDHGKAAGGIPGMMDESALTWQRQFGTMMDTLDRFGKYFMQRFERPLTIGLYYVNKFLIYLSEFVVALDRLIFGVNKVGDALGGGSKEVEKFELSWWSLAAGIGTIVAGYGILRLAIYAVGSAFQVAMSYMASGFASLQPYIGVMLALSVLFVAVAVSIYIIASAAVMLGREGANGAVALVLLTAAIIGMGIALAFAGQIVQASTLGLIVLSLSLIAVAAASYIFAMAVSIIAAHGMAGAVAVLALAGAMSVMAIALAFAGTLAAPVIGPIFLLVLALGLLMGVAMLGALAVRMLVAAFAGITPELVQNALGFAGAVVVMSVSLLASSAMLLVAGLLLLASVPPLLLAALGLTAASLAYLAIGAILKVVAVWLMASGVALVISGAMLMVGAVAIAAAATVMMVSAVGMMVASVLLVASSVIFVAAAAALSAGAVVLVIGSAAVAVAAASIVLAAIALTSGAAALIVASVLVGLAAAALTGAAVLIGFASVAISVAATTLLPAAILVAVGGVALAVAAMSVAVAGLVLGVASIELLVAAATLFVAATMLLTASGVVLLASAALLISFVALLGVALELGAALVVLTPAALALMIASFFLSLSGGLLADAGATLAVGAAALAMALPVLLRAAEMVWPVVKAFGVSVAGLVPQAYALAKAGAAIQIGGLALAIGSLAFYQGIVALYNGLVLAKQLPDSSVQLVAAVSIMTALVTEISKVLMAAMPTLMVAAVVLPMAMAMLMMLVNGAVLALGAFQTITVVAIDLGSVMLRLGGAILASATALLVLKQALAEPIGDTAVLALDTTVSAFDERFGSLAAIVSSYSQIIRSEIDGIGESLTRLGAQSELAFNLNDLKAARAETLTPAAMYDRPSEIFGAQDQTGGQATVEDVVLVLKRIEQSLDSVEVDNEAVDGIRKLLEEYLPDIARLTLGGLAKAFNKWTH